jgi:hypothetical protein
MFLSRQELFDIMRQSESNNVDDQADYLLAYMVKKTNCPEEHMSALRKNLSTFQVEFKRRWRLAYRKQPRFLQNNQQWLSAPMIFLKFKWQGGGGGRPNVQFAESSDRSKRRKTASLRESSSLDELAYATQMSLRAGGKASAAKIVKEISTSSPERANKYHKAFKAHQKTTHTRLPGEEALSVIVDAQLTRHQYNVVRAKDKMTFPSYKSVQVAKKKCYPSQDTITVTETLAEVELQSLLNHTVQRLVQVHKDSLVALSAEELGKLHLISKWGFDGSSGYGTYKQKFESSDEFDDSSIFFTSLVPLQLVCGNPDSIAKPRVIWKNPRPSSTRFCRPIKMEFVHETENHIREQEALMKTKIRDLEITPVKVEEQWAFVAHKLLFTMVDGKVCNAVTETKFTQKCYLCGATARNFNDIDKMIEMKTDTENVRFGLSILHGWIRSFECLLHLAYKLPVKMWAVRTQKDKEIVGKNKKRIQKAFRDELSLIIDRPKPGFGSTNDGNTARTFFRHKDISSKITGVDEELIERLYVIMQAVASGYQIDVSKFKIYAFATARLFVKKYPWYNMPPTVHKILIHGPDIISNALLPIGQLSEEAQEARNKEIKKYRLGYSRKISRTKTNQDVLNMLLISSDPMITSLRKLPQKKTRQLSSTARELLKLQDAEEEISDDESLSSVTSGSTCSTSDYMD